MPYDINEEENGLLIEVTGFAVPFEFADCAALLAAHPRRLSHHYHLFDFSGIDQDSQFALTDAIGADYAKRSRAIHGDTLMPYMTALVSPHSKIQVVFQAFIDAAPRPPGHELRRFTNLKQARTWIRERLAGDGSENAG